MISPGLRDRPRGRPSRAEPAGPTSCRGTRGGAAANAAPVRWSCRPTVSLACGRTTRTQRDLLEPGDVDEGLSAAAAIGDDRLQKQSRGVSCRSRSRTAARSNGSSGCAAACRLGRSTRAIRTGSEGPGAEYTQTNLRRNVANVEENASGSSTLARWPTAGIRTSVEPAIASCIASLSAGGVRTSSSPTTIRVGTSIVASVGLESGGRAAALSPQPRLLRSALRSAAARDQPCSAAPSWSSIRAAAAPSRWPRPRGPRELPGRA